MAPEYPDNMTSKSWTGDRPTESTPLPYFFSHPTQYTYSNCYKDHQERDRLVRVRKFFSLSPDINCVAIQSQGISDYNVLVSPGPNAPFHKIGTFEFGHGRGSVPEIVRIYLNPLQKIFPESALDFLYIGVASMDQKFETLHFKKAGTNDDQGPLVQIRVNPHGIAVDGFMGNDIVEDLIVGTRPY